MKGIIKISKLKEIKMKKNKKRGIGYLGIILIIVLILAITLIPSYNNLVKLQGEVDESYAQVENVVQRRADLIPNLVNTVKGYASHEESTLENVTKARAGISDAQSPKELAEANERLSQEISNINVVAEKYPDLKADKQFTQLMDELAGSENRISVERKNYNSAVKNYNTKIKSFPTKIVAGLGGFDQAEYFKATDEAQKAPEVNFGN